MRAVARVPRTNARRAAEIQLRGLGGARLEEGVGPGRLARTGESQERRREVRQRRARRKATARPREWPRPRRRSWTRKPGPCAGRRSHRARPGVCRCRTSACRPSRRTAARPRRRRNAPWMCTAPRPPRAEAGTRARGARRLPRRQSVAESCSYYNAVRQNGQALFISLPQQQVGAASPPAPDVDGPLVT